MHARGLACIGNAMNLPCTGKRVKANQTIPYNLQLHFVHEEYAGVLVCSTSQGTS